jgi:hypothetical protein
VGGVTDQKLIIDRHAEALIAADGVKPQEVIAQQWLIARR